MGLFSKKTPEDHIENAFQLMVDGDLEKAAKILKRYAEEGYVIAMLYYANCLMQKDMYHFDEALVWLFEAKEAVDDPDVQAYADELLQVISDSVNAEFDMGEKAFAEHRQKDALEWYTLAAQNHHVKAMYTLAKLYHEGDVSIDKNIDLAIQWYTAAAKVGHVDSMSELADIYHLGAEIKCDMEKAIYWYQQAADHGDFQAEYMLQALNE
ncbi:MAG: sel1 repeat family protein [Oscillospiraceae bacterium]|nr:sel1 repeat family protein [Oscillospiraceae bacterium]